MNNKGIIIRQSDLPVKDTIDRIAGVLTKNNVKIYARIDQRSEAKQNGIDLLPLEFLLFGSPQKGGVLVAANPLSALDLPLKVIAWEDKQQKVWVAYNDAAYIQQRYALDEQAAKLIDIDAVITKILNAAL